MLSRVKPIRIIQRRAATSRCSDLIELPTSLMSERTVVVTFSSAVVRPPV